MSPLPIASLQVRLKFVFELPKPRLFSHRSDPKDKNRSFPSFTACFPRNEFILTRCVVGDVTSQDIICRGGKTLPLYRFGQFFYYRISDNFMIYDLRSLCHFQFSVATI